MLANHFFLVCFLIQELRDCDMRAKEVLIYRVLVLVEWFLLDWSIILSRCMVEVAIVNSIVASETGFAIIGRC